jgi:hypothetical protein
MGGVVVRQRANIPFANGHGGGMTDWQQACRVFMKKAQCALGKHYSPSLNTP